MAELDVELRVVEPLAATLPARPPEVTLVINGGFFDTEGEPEGLLVIDSETQHPYRRGLGGGIFALDAERGVQLDGETFDEAAPRPPGVRFAIQARPRLVVASRNNIRSDNGRRAARTALCLRDAGRTLEVWVAFDTGEEVSGPTLFELGAHMAAEGCDEALNLDGGPSTAFADEDETRSPRGPLREALLFRRTPASSVRAR